MRCFLIFLSSLIVVFLAIPAIIKVTFKIKMFDVPSETRKIHKITTPNSGGIAIFMGFLFSCLIFIPFNLLPQANILMAGALIVFSMGLVDDIDDLNPLKKLIAQFIAAIIVVVLANLRITNLYGTFGIYELSSWLSILLSVFFFVGIVNAFNLIDGIDGLAGSLGVLLSLFYAFLFFQVGQMGYCYMSVSLTGALIGFLFFNISPAKIFMGDSGSLLLGFIIVVLSIRIMSNDLTFKLARGSLPINAISGLVTAILVIPIFDTIRVLSMRIYKGVSPFTADDNHLHHRLLSLGLNHRQATSLLVFVNSLFVLAAVHFQYLGNTLLIISIVIGMLIVNGLLSLLIIRHKKIIA